MLEPQLRDTLLAARHTARQQGINAEFSLHREHSSLIRLANSAVALSTSEELTRLDISVQDGRRVGSYSLLSGILTPEQISACLDQARENCAAAIPKDYDPIFGRVEENFDDSRGYDPALEELSPETKASLCARVIEAIGHRDRYTFSGSWSTGSTEVYYITTANDNEAYRRLTDGRLALVLKHQQQRWELQIELTQKRAGEFSADDAIASFERLLPVYESNPPHRPSVGRQRVLFGPQAIAQLLHLALWSGFNGRGWEEKRTFTCQNQPGDKIFSDLITICDDPDNPDVFSMPFDFNGRRRKRFVIVENGIFRALCYDSAAAAKYNRQPTGHDLESIDLVLEPGSGQAGLDAGLRLAGDALYIPHLHYIHVPDITKGVITGSSRFNAMLIRDGRFVAPIFSSRVTDTLPDILGNVLGLSSKSVSQNESSTYGRRSPEAYSVPEWLLCESVRISDVAESF
ncbi:MAG: metallopeptidase TldD-related protein [candidate division WOR-3 bacterium]